MYYRVMREIHSKIDWAKKGNYTLFGKNALLHKWRIWVNKAMRGVITHMGSSWTPLRGLRSWDRDPGGRDPGPQIGTPDPDRDPGPGSGPRTPDRDPGPRIGTPDPGRDPRIRDLRPPDRGSRTPRSGSQTPRGVITPSEVFGSRHDVIKCHKMT